MTGVNRTDPLFDQVYEILWDRILSGEVTHGTRLSDLEWSKKLNVSRTPVREAMRKLHQDGILVQRDRGGSEVRRMNEGNLRDLYRCRAALEGLATRDAVQFLGPSDHAELFGIVDTAQAAIDRDDFHEVFELNTRFHKIITGASSNPFLERFLLDLGRLIIFARSSLMVAAHQSETTAEYLSHLERIQTDHREIVEALQTGDPDAAAARMEAHLFSTADDMVALAHRITAT